MLMKLRGPLVTVLAMLVVASQVRAELTAEKVRQSIELGTRYLKSQQNRSKGSSRFGSWPDHLIYEGGVTSLCTLALLNAGEPVDSEPIQRALNYLRSLEDPKFTYSTALQTMVFCAAEPEKDMAQIRRNVRWLESIQVDAGPRKGTWGYSGTRGTGDNSNTQFALLGLHEAARVGVEVREETWRNALDYWLRTQKDDGSWGYYEDQPSTGSMTCAGIASLIVTMDKLPEYQGDATITGDSVACCGKQANIDRLELAFDWLGRHFSYTRNPGPENSHLLYYMYGVERVGRLSGRRFFLSGTRLADRHDWYREIAEWLVAHQDPTLHFWVGVGTAEQNKQVATAFALLFLSKGRRPVLMAKYKHSDDSDWNLHRKGVQNLTHSVERAWKQPLTWQTVDARAAKVDDLLQSPVLFISGRDSLNLTSVQKDALREYVNQGGFIFAENCCDGRGFREQFRNLMKEIFPNSSLNLLSPDHPVWYAEGKVNSKYLRPLYGIEACCRTSVVYCEGNLSCYWELAREGHTSKYPAVVQEEVDACIRIGQNVLAYATNRQVQDKLDRPRVNFSDSDLQRTRDLLYIPKIRHDGGSDDAPNALSNLLRIAAQELDMRISTKKDMVAPGDVELFNYPIVFMHGRRSFRFSPTQRKSLATYLERGGFLFADSICASREFTKSFRKEIEAIMPDAKLVPIPPDHPMLTREFRGYDIRSVVLRRREARTEEGPLRAKKATVPPQLEGLEINQRLAVVFSPYDLSCALENASSLECESYEKSDAAKIGINILLYALQQ